MRLLLLPPVLLLSTGINLILWILTINININISYCYNITVSMNWCGGEMVRALDVRSTGQLQPFYFHVTTLGKLFTYMCLMLRNLLTAKTDSYFPTEGWPDWVDLAASCIYRCFHADDYYTSSFFILFSLSSWSLSTVFTVTVVVANWHDS